MDKLFVLLAIIVPTLPICGSAATIDTPKMTAAEIVDKNVAARGGLQAWRSVKTMVMEGEMGAGGNRKASVSQPPPGKKLAAIPTDPRPREEVQLPFKLLLQRPRKNRFELQFNGQTALQVFDGVNGWKVRPYLNRSEVEPFTTEELNLASTQAELDGYLVDSASKGTKIELEGIEKVEDRDAYKLKLTLNNGRVMHVWIDARNYLEVKIEGQPRRLDGIEHPVEVYYREYRTVNGLQIPFVLETIVLPAKTPNQRAGSMSIPVQTERIVFDKVEINPTLDASLFVEPKIGALPARHP
jgi:outer membrane lipoprotein-sorting protein